MWHSFIYTYQIEKKLMLEKLNVPSLATLPDKKSTNANIHKKERCMSPLKTL